MKKTTDGFRAHQLEGIIAEDVGEFSSRFLFVLEWQPGLYRRIPKKSEKPKPDGALVAWFDGGLVDLVRVPAMEKELAEAGFISYRPMVTFGPFSLHDGLPNTLKAANLPLGITMPDLPASETASADESKPPESCAELSAELSDGQDGVEPVIIPADNENGL